MYPPISSYALIGDCHSVALVSLDGSVDWCCFHRFDSPSVFGRLLDWRSGGHFSIAPVAGFKSHRRYADDSKILETTFETESGSFLLVDFMPISEGVGMHHQLIRIVEGLAGRVDLSVEFSPRFDYGLTIPQITETEDGLLRVTGGSDSLVLQSDLPLGESPIVAGERRLIAVSHVLPHNLDPQPLSPGEIERRLDVTRDFWSEWSSRCSYNGEHREAVVRSALVIKAMTNLSTGAIVAAATTSLPEVIGGERNWDYRFVWVRDAAINLYSLFALGYRDEAKAFIAWLERASAGRAQDLQPVYGVGGERMLTEIEMDLEGYRGSKPVRVGNAASEQFQMDAYGQLLDTAYLFQKFGGEMDDEFWEFLCGVVEQVRIRWREPDEGIWEVRDARHHFTSSKVFAWVALDRAIKMSESGGFAEASWWRDLREEIRDEVLSRGVDESHVFYRAFDDKGPDASNLLIPLVGFLEGDDERVRATVADVEKRLMRGTFVDRYHAQDGLPGKEGGWVVCAFWMVSALAATGEVDRARDLFTRILESANDVGLFSEQIDPHSGEFLGNFPQAFAHAALIAAAISLDGSSDNQ